MNKFNTYNKKKKKDLIKELIELHHKITDLEKSLETLREIENKLKNAEEKYKALFERSLDCVYIHDFDGKFIDANDAALKLLGYTRQEIPNITFSSLLEEDQLSLAYKNLNNLLKTKNQSVTNEYKLRKKDGNYVWVETEASLIYKGGKPYAIQGIAKDITERKFTEEALRESEKKFRTLADNALVGIYRTNLNGEILYVNEAFLNILEYDSLEELRPVGVLSTYKNTYDREILIQRLNKKGKVQNFETELLTKTGKSKYVMLNATINKDIISGMVMDITDLKKIENQLRYLSLHDPLTGLYNRAYFEEEMHRIENGRYDSVGIIMCDVDGLKLINDALGHHMGDKLLLSTAHVLRESFREADVIARVGGDEFAILLPNSDEKTLKLACQRIRDTAKHYNSSELGMPLSLSLGYAISSDTPTIMSNLFKEADNNMYREKLHHSLSARSTIVQTLMRALETRDFVKNGHIRRLKKLSTALANFIKLPEQEIKDLRNLAEFHDIGKVGINPEILFKKGPYSRHEALEMQKHCEIGHRIALCTPDLLPIADLILKHHEWWNGKGYPLGIKGEEIPLVCRIFAVVEAYEAMTHNRIYHNAKSHEEAINELKRLSGTKFDPNITTMFIEFLENSNFFENIN